MKSEEMIQRIKQLPLPPPDSGRWQYHASSIHQYIRELNLSPDEFLTWPAVVSTMFVGDGSQLREEYEDLRKLPGWFFYEHAAYEDNVGDPKASELAPGMNSNLLHQVYHLSRWEIATHRRIKEVSSIVEVGGGYGGLAKVCRQLGFAGTYTLIDLPEFLILQEYYLSKTVGVRDCVFVDNPLALPPYVELMIGVYSLSEMSLPERDTILENCNADSYLFAYMETYDGINNDEYFVHFAGSRPLAWKWLKAACMPTCHYLVGAPQLDKANPL